MSEKYCSECDKYPVQKGFRYCCVCKIKIEKGMAQADYLQKTFYKKIHRSRSSKEGSDE